MKKLTLEISGAVPLGRYKPGQRFKVETADGKKPIDPYWQRRLADAEDETGDKKSVRVVPASELKRAEKTNSQNSAPDAPVAEPSKSAKGE